MKATAKFTKEAQARGEYKTTSIDELKNNAEILIENCDGTSYTINTKGIELTGRGIKARYSNGNYEVTENLLHKLQAKYNVMTNF